MFRKLIPVLLLTLLLVACGGGGGGGEAEPTAMPEGEGSTVPEATMDEEMDEDATSMALVLIGPAEDGSWAEAAYSALEAKADEGVTTAFSESVSDADVARVMREYADEGFDIIIAHSFSYQDATFEVASEYPDVNFAWAGAIDRTGENVADYDQPFHEAAYLVGILAGYTSASGSLGALYGFDIPACHAMGEAMLAGAQTVNPDATLTFTAVGDWGDVAAAKEAGLAQIDTAGVDFFLGCGEGPTLGSIEAAQENGAYATGYVGDMSDLGPESVLSSIVWDMTSIFDAIYTDTDGDAFNGPYYQFGVAEGALDIVINPALEGDIPAEALTAIEEAKAAITDGSLEVPFIPE